MIGVIGFISCGGSVRGDEGTDNAVDGAAKVVDEIVFRVSDRVIGEIVGGDRAGQPAELEGTLLNLSEKSLIRQLILQVE